MDGEVTWALLAAIEPDRLDSLAREYWYENVVDDEDDYLEEGWKFLEGKKAYSALIDSNPGSEYTHEVVLAERLSTVTKDPVYILYLNEQFGGSDPVAVYEAGRQTGDRPDAEGIARSLGIILPIIRNSD